MVHDRLLLCEHRALGSIDQRRAMHSFIRFLAIALPWLFFLVGMEVFLDTRSTGEFVFVPSRIFYLLLPVYAGIVVIVFRLTRKEH